MVDAGGIKIACGLRCFIVRRNAVASWCVLSTADLALELHAVALATSLLRRAWERSKPASDLDCD